MDFGVPEVPKLHSLSRTLYDNKVYPEACNHPPCCWAINVCFHISTLPNIEAVRKFFCGKLSAYTKLTAVVQPEDGAWFPTVLGLFKLSQAALNWVVGGVYTPIAQAMMAFQLGGAAYTHVVAEGKPKELGGVVVFSCVTLTAQVQHGALGLGAA